MLTAMLNCATIFFGMLGFCLTVQSGLRDSSTSMRTAPAPTLAASSVEWTRSLLSAEKAGQDRPRLLHASTVASSMASANAFMSAPNLAIFLMEAGQLVDVRERDNYATSHLAGSVNIPSDELASRARHELHPSRPVAIVCEYRGSCEARALGDGQLTSCIAAAQELRALGFETVRVVEGSVSDLIKDEVTRMFVSTGTESQKR